MPPDQTCPQCGQPMLVVDTGSMRPANCPACQAQSADNGLAKFTSLAAPSPSGAIDATGDSDEDVNPFAAPMVASTRRYLAATDADLARDNGWDAVRIGLTISFYSLCVGLVSFAVFSIAMTSLLNLIDGDDTGRSGHDTLGVTSAYTVLIGTGWGLLGVAGSMVSLLTGWCVLTGTPRRCRAQGLITGAVGCMAIALLVSLLQSVLPIVAMGGAAGIGGTFGKLLSVFPWVIEMAVIIAFAMFGFYLAAVAKHFHDARLSSHAGYYAMFQTGVAAWSTVSSFALDADSGGLYLIEMVAFIVLGLLDFGWLVYLVSRCNYVVRVARAKALAVA